jgi:hypothetical protein
MHSTLTLHQPTTVVHGSGLGGVDVDHGCMTSSGGFPLGYWWARPCGLPIPGADSSP